MTFEWWFAYLLTSIILSLSPGSGAINTMTTSINHGYRGAAASIAGLQTGLGIHIVLVGIGLGTLFSRSVLAFEVLFRGSIDSASVYPRQVVKRALANNAAAVILTHNHPSGVSEPSQADRVLTQRLKDALALVEVRVLDHFIVGDGEPLSMAELGWM